GVHLGCLLVFLIPFSWYLVGVAVLLYVARMFGITAGYHRYFSHRTYRTSRFFQFLMAFLGLTAAQKGPLWWASHHRRHHLHSDTEDDIHSVKQHGFWHAHVGWILNSGLERVDYSNVKDLARFPELVFLDKYYYIGPAILVIFLILLGNYFVSVNPQTPLTPLNLVVYGFFVSTTLLYHGTFFINSLCHMIGKQRFNTGDESRNSFLMAIVCLGEGWHNNHHYYPSSERQGFYWWEIDPTHWGLKLLQFLGLVWDIKKPPKEILSKREAESY
ncbi:MAG: acyl-CoA desaturase, partial [Deltaproteobacteria bacterium]|nr:acyl-CoA desaturase [Deltaproteobacteria bacterium]